MREWSTKNELRTRVLRKFPDRSKLDSSLPPNQATRLCTNDRVWRYCSILSFVKANATRSLVEFRNNFVPKTAKQLQYWETKQKIWGSPPSWSPNFDGNPRKIRIPAATKSTQASVPMQSCAMRYAARHKSRAPLYTMGGQKMIGRRRPLRQ